MTPTIQKIETILARHQKYKNCYFWTNTGSAASRRAQEARDSETLEFDFKGDHYLIRQDVTCSYRNTYYSLHVERNGQRKDVRAVKGLLRDLQG